jgi:hypothetical protein
MNALASEYQDVFRLYLRLGKDLAEVMDIDEKTNPQDYVESILANREYLMRLEQMNSRILRLSEEWQKGRGTLDLESQDEIEELAVEARAQAVRLKELCGIHVQKLQRVRNKIADDLAEIGRGAEYLKSTKPIKNNYPKFIDSLY